MTHRNYRSYSDRLVLPVHTHPMAPNELRHRKPVDYAKMNKGKSKYLNIRTVSSMKAYYPPPDLTEDKIVDLASIMARDMKRLERDDNSSQADTEQVIARIYRISTLLERYVPVEDIGDDSSSVGKALKIDAAMGDQKFEHTIKAEVLENLINKTGTLEEISNEQVKELGAHTFIHTVVKCKRKLNPDGTYDKHKARTRRIPPEASRAWTTASSVLQPNNQCPHFLIHPPSCHVQELTSRHPGHQVHLPQCASSRRRGTNYHQAG